VYQNYQFCGKSCANAWRATHGQNNQTSQKGGRPGQKQGGSKWPNHFLTLHSFLGMRSDAFVGGVVQGFVKGFKSIISSDDPTQPQMAPPKPSQSQQFFVNVTSPMPNTGPPVTPSPVAVVSPTTPNQFPPWTFPHPYNFPHPTAGGPLNHDDNQLGQFNGMYHISPVPIQSYSSGRSAPQIPNNTDPDPPQTTPSTVLNGASPPPYSIEDPACQYKEGGDGTDEVFWENMDIQSTERPVYPPPVTASGYIGTYRREGHSNSAFVDPRTDLENKHFSQKYQV